MREHQQRRRRPLQVESLETLTLLSGLSTLGVAAPHAIVAEAVKASAAATVNFTSATTGVYVAIQAKPITGLQFTVNTSGIAAGGGVVSVFGKLNTPGFTAKGRTTGTLIVFSAAGNLTLAVAGSTQSGFSGLPSTLNFTIVGGTGVFKHHFAGKGTIAVAVQTEFSGPARTTNGQLTLALTAIRGMT